MGRVADRHHAGHRARPDRPRRTSGAAPPRRCAGRGGPGRARCRAGRRWRSRRQPPARHLASPPRSRAGPAPTPRRGRHPRPRPAWRGRRGPAPRRYAAPPRPAPGGRDGRTRRRPTPPRPCRTTGRPAGAAGPETAERPGAHRAAGRRAAALAGQRRGVSAPRRLDEDRARARARPRRRRDTCLGIRVARASGSRSSSRSVAPAIDTVTARRGAPRAVRAISCAQPVASSCSASTLRAKPPTSGGGVLELRPGQQDLAGMRVRRARLGVQVVAVVPDRHQPEVVHRRERRGPGADHDPPGAARRRRGTRGSGAPDPRRRSAPRGGRAPSRSVSAASRRATSRRSGTHEHAATAAGQGQRAAAAPAGGASPPRGAPTRPPAVHLPSPGGRGTPRPPGRPTTRARAGD